MATKKVVVRTGLPRRTKSKIVRVKTGAKVPVSGQYRAGSGKAEVTLIKGHRVPPNRWGTIEAWHLVDKTKHPKKR